MTGPKLRPCGNPSCRICRWRDTDPPDSGHPDDSLASLLVGTAAIVVLFVVAFVLLPVLA